MKTGKRIGIVLFTAAAVFTGFFLPGWMADYQEQKDLSQVHVYESEEIQFSSAYHIIDCMEMFPSGCELAELQSGREHTWEDMRTLAGDIYRQIAECGIDRRMTKVEMYLDSMNVFLAVADGRDDGTEVYAINGETSFAKAGANSENADAKQRDGESAADPDARQAKEGGNGTADLTVILWECHFVSEVYGSECWLWIDDLSGKLIAVTCDNPLFTGEKETVYTAVHEDADVMLDGMLQFGESHYGFLGGEILVGNDDSGTYRLQFYDKSGRSVDVPVMITQGGWSFNAGDNGTRQQTGGLYDNN